MDCPALLLGDLRYGDVLAVDVLDLD